MRVRLIGMALAALLTLSEGCGSSPVIYQVTVRDFLPIWCMPEVEANSLGLGDGESFNFKAGQRLGSFCPYQSYIDSGEVSGHPDFNRPGTAGWNLQFLYDLEDTFGVNTILNGTCDLNDVNVTSRPPNLDKNVRTGARGICESRLRNFSPRMNFTTMDIAPSGLPKPQYCTSDPNGRCGFFLKEVVDQTLQKYQTANKFFQDLWYIDNKRYNKRIGTTIVLNERSPECNGVFQFDSLTDQENNETNGTAIGKYAPHGHSEFIFHEEEHPDPFEAKAWPLMSRDTRPTLNIKGTEKFLHTTEIHSFFEYRGDEQFIFSGDDDVWVYINGILAINLGGLHGDADQLIDLSHPFAKDYLNIEVGGIYTFDLYQAERQPPGSNFKVSTTLAEACNVLTSRKRFFPDQDGNSIVKSRGVEFSFVDGSVYAGEEIGLLPAGSTSISTYIFVGEEINVGSGFIVDFKFRASGQPEGFAFVLHQRPEGLTNIPISTGPNLGFKGISNSIAVAFDMCRDRGISSSCEEQNVTIYYPETASDFNKPGSSSQRVYDPIMRSLKYGDEHKVRISYFFRPPALEVTIDDSLYLREIPFNPVDTLGSIAAFAGLTATAGEIPGNITIYDWEMQSVDVDSSLTEAVDFNNTEPALTPKEILGDNIQATGYSVQTKDLCEFSIEFGNRAQNTGAKFIEEKDPVTGLLAKNRTSPLIVEAEIEDSEDGTYTYNLRVLDEGIFSLYLYYGDREKTCNFDVTPAGSDYVVTNGPGSDGCYYASVLRAVRVFPLTSAPTAAPTASGTLPPTGVGPEVLVTGIGGGTIIGLVVIAILLFFVYRRRWQREKKYILDGWDYRLDAETIYDPRSPLTTVGQQLQSTRAEITRARAGRDKQVVIEDMARLEIEQEELMETIQTKKRALTENQAMARLKQPPFVSPEPPPRFEEQTEV